jgi:hypothetical protein
MLLNKFQNEHECLSVAFESIRWIHREGGFRASVLGREVNIRYGYILSLETLRVIINGWVTIRGLHAKLIGFIKIVSVTLMKCQIQIQPVSILH